MRFTSLLTHSTTLLVLQQVVVVWFLIDFFLARDSSTANMIFFQQTNRHSTASETIRQIDTTTNDLKRNLNCEELITNRPKFDKIILVVIDALGSEFLPILSAGESNQNVSEHKMPFIEGLLAQHQGIGFVAKAATPTVTMPRIKALVSGTIPSFMDVVYNLANDVSDFHDDNLLSLAKAQGKELVFYGDDTWLSLFDKSMFKRFRKTLSLYASDYISVDTNVTEMAIPETQRNPIDWDYLILHYLGLDHIGHVFGSNEGPLIDKKLAEMDDVIREMYNNMASKEHRTLMVMCGDHGMSQEGNHGGDTRLESDTAMLFLPINHQFAHPRSIDSGNIKQVSQIDLAITLAFLTGLPEVPKMSRGVVIEQILQAAWGYDATKLTCANIENLRQLSSLLEDSELNQPDGLGIRALNLLKRMDSNTTTENSQSFIQQTHAVAQMLQAHLVRVVTTKSDNFLVLAIVAFVMAMSVLNMRRSCIRLLMPLMSSGEKLACIGAILLPMLMLNSTDYIEMEHAFWPVYSVIVFALFCLVSLQIHPTRLIKQDIELMRVVLFIITFLITSLWNHATHLGRQDLGWSLPVISVIIMCNFSRQTSRFEGRQTGIFFAIGLSVFVTKVVEETSERHENHHTKVAMLQVAATLLLLMTTITNIYTSFAKHDRQATSIVQKMATSWMWWVFLLSRSRNYVFLISNVVMEASLNSLSNSLRFSPIMRAIAYLQFANSAFYGQGNTNLFSTLDIKPAFFGQTQYNIVLAVPLIACATFGSQIYWYIKLFQRVQGEKEQERMSSRPGESSKLIPEGTKDAIKDFVDMRNFLTLGYYIFVCAVLRNHLFIWSVVSPKLVYLFLTTLIIRLATAMISKMPRLYDRLFNRDETNVRTYKELIEL